MSYPNERRVIADIEGCLYSAERAIKEALNYGTPFQTDMAEMFLTIARCRGQLTVLSCKLNALESDKKE